MKTYFPAYRRKMVAGFVPTHTARLKRGQIVTFKYPEDRSRVSSKGTGSVPRLVFVLNLRASPAGGGKLLHGLNLSHIPWTNFRTFIKKLITQDTLTLIKRRYEMKAPVNELIDRPKVFYSNYIKNYLGEYPSYRTYSQKLIKQPKLGILNYATVFPPSDKQLRDLLIGKKESLREIREELTILNKVIDMDTLTLKDDKWKQLILSRFGSVENFVDAVLNIEKYIDETATTDMSDIDKLLE